MASIKAKVEIDEEQIIERVKKFHDEINKLCEKYGFMPSIAEDEETKDKYIAINLKDLIAKEDIKVSMGK